MKKQLNLAPWFLGFPWLASLVGIVALVTCYPISMLRPSGFSLSLTSLLGQISIAVLLGAAQVPKPKKISQRAMVVGATGLALMTILCNIGQLLLLPMDSKGFAACYKIQNQTNSSFNSGNDCEKSYSQPFASVITRYDAAIDFGNVDAADISPPMTISETNWNLSAINSLEYNFYGDSNQRRTKLPFSVSWSGVAESDFP